MDFITCVRTLARLNRFKKLYFNEVAVIKFENKFYGVPSVVKVEILKIVGNKAKLSEHANSVQHGMACRGFTSTPKAFRISKQTDSHLWFDQYN